MIPQCTATFHLQAQLGDVADIGMKQAMANKWLAVNKADGTPKIQRKVGSCPKQRYVFQAIYLRGRICHRGILRLGGITCSESVMCCETLGVIEAVKALETKAETRRGTCGAPCRSLLFRFIAAPDEDCRGRDKEAVTKLLAEEAVAVEEFPMSAQCHVIISG